LTSDVQAAEEPLCQNRTLFEEIYEQSPDAMVVVDEISRMERVNERAEALFGSPGNTCSVSQSICSLPGASVIDT
jgi:PAS domain-containing protein